MSGFIPWNSQTLDEWANHYARGKFLEIDGLSMHYVVKGVGKPIILLHGFFFDTNMWNESIDVLAQKYQVYAVDLWGFGYSDRTPMDYGYPLYSQQLLKFINALDIQKGSLIGQSMGGGTIIYFAVSNQERVDKVVLVNSAGMPNALPLMGKISNLPGVGEFMYGHNSNFIRKFILENNFIHNKHIITDEFFEDITRFHKIRGSSEVMLYITRKQFFDTLLDEIKALSLLNIPKLIVWGRDEKSIALPIGSELHRLLNGSRFEVLDQAGHCSNIDQHRILNRLVFEFFTQNE